MYKIEVKDKMKCYKYIQDVLKSLSTYAKNNLRQDKNILEQHSHRNKFREDKRSLYEDCKTLVSRFGYLPYSHQRVLEELNNFEVIELLQIKMSYYKNNVKIFMSGKEFKKAEDIISPVEDAGYRSGSWLGKELHKIKIINLSALGNGKNSEQPGKLMDWLRQIVILPSGLIEEGILGTSIYLLPFHTREFQCNYIPKANDISEKIIDREIEKKLGLNGRQQVKFFIQLSRACGHPVIYDVLPQTGRFHLEVLQNPYVVRWIDISAIEKEQRSNIASKDVQALLVEKVRNVINNFLHSKGTPNNKESIAMYHNEIISELINQQLWPLPGGAWNSYHLPIYSHKDEGIPVFIHVDRDGNDVSKEANLDCQSPYYFYHLEEKEYNERVIEFWLDKLDMLQQTYNFDGFRIDHVDHVVDYYSVEKEQPISYRTPSKVLALMNKRLKEKNPHFATLAEYMLWDNLMEHYHIHMGFDVLWGNDIVAQCKKDITTINRDNLELEQYNLEYKENPLSILKTYNNQDGIYKLFNQYPGQLSHKGALFKWLKLHFLPGGNFANRSILYVDGDESFTKKGVQYGINHEVSLIKNRDDEFTSMFNAIELFSKKKISYIKGFLDILEYGNDEGFVGWTLIDLDKKDGILIIANEKPPTECIIAEKENHIHVKGYPIYNKKLKIHNKFIITGEYKLENCQFVNKKSHLKKTSELCFENLQPSEFHIYHIEVIE